MHPPSSGALKECQTTKPRQTVERSAANTLDRRSMATAVFPIESPPDEGDETTGSRRGLTRWRTYLAFPRWRDIGL